MVLFLLWWGLDVRRCEEGWLDGWFGLVWSGWGRLGGIDVVGVHGILVHLDLDLEDFDGFKDHRFLTYRSHYHTTVMAHYRLKCTSVLGHYTLVSSPSLRIESLSLTN